jgi:hypothetical protein
MTAPRKREPVIRGYDYFDQLGRDPVVFGRKRVPLTEGQVKARFAALALFAVFLASLAGALKTSSAGGAVLLTVMGFGALFVGVVAAGEA